MNECDLYAPVREWLQANGWTVYCEVFEADVVAKRGDEILVVELKLGMHRSLDRQLQRRAMWADWVYAAVPASCYKRRAWWASNGYGALAVDGTAVKQVMKPRRQPCSWHSRHAYRLKVLAARNPAHPADRAGLPANAERAAVRRRAIGLDRSAGVSGAAAPDMASPAQRGVNGSAPASLHEVAPAASMEVRG